MGKQGAPSGGSAVQPGQRSRWWRRPIAAGPLGPLLARPAFVPVSLAVALVLIGGTGLQIALRLGWTPPGPWHTAPHMIAVTGPGVDQPTNAIVAEILGAVPAPGVYGLPSGARVGDLVHAAGGLTPDADATRVDLAAHLADGQEVYVPRVGEVIPADLSGLVNINTASAEAPHDALGISLDAARRIVAYRVAHGPYTAVSQLLLVPISRTTYDRIRYVVTI